MHAINPPLIESWVLAHTYTIENKIWTEECQGITTDGNFWYVVSNNEDKRALYKFPLDFSASSTLVFPEEHHIEELPSLWQWENLCPGNRSSGKSLGGKHKSCFARDF